MIDRRNEKTEKIIKDTFLNLLKTKNLNKISVAEISRQANLGRGTFYLHYTDVYDLYENIENKIMDNLSKVFEKAFPTTNAENSEKLTQELTLYIEKNKEIFRILTRVDNGNTMYKLKKLFYSKVFKEDTILNPNGDKQFDLTESIFVVSGIIGVLEKWIIDDFCPSQIVIAKMLNDIIVKINKNL